MSDEKDLSHIRNAKGKPFDGQPQFVDLIGGKRVNAGGRAKPGEEDDIIDIPEWPTPPAPEAFDGLAGDFGKLWQDHTEADHVALLIQFLTFFGHAVGREAYFAVGGDNHRANLYTLLVGTSSKARKGQSYGCVKYTYDMVAPPSSTPFNGQTAAVLPPSETLAILHEASGLSSGEGLINSVRDESMGTNKKGERVILDHGIDDKRLLVQESEFASTLRRMSRDGNTLSETIRDGWDCKPTMGTMTRTSPLKATKPFISILGHITRYDLQMYLNDVSLTNGFANRFMFIATRRIRKLPNPGRPRLDALNAFASRLASVIAAARKVKQMHRSIDANVLWTSVYDQLEAPRTGRLHNSVMGRASAYVVRLSMLYALLDSGKAIESTDKYKSNLKHTGRIIESRHIRSALALWNYAERTSKFIFGDSLGDKLAEKIEKMLVEAGASGLTTREITHKSGAKKGVPDALRLLVDCERVRVEELKDTKANRGQRWFIR